MPLVAHYRPNRVSIALITMMAAGPAVNHIANADQATLPRLQNNQAIDRVLQREIGDEYVYDSESSDQKLETPSVILPTPASQTQPAVKKVDNQDTTSIDAKQQSAPKAKLQAEAQAKAQAESAKAATKKVEKSADSATGNLPETTQTQSPASTTLKQSGKTITTDSVWHRIIQSNRIPLNDSPKVQFYIEQYQRESMWISKILERGKPYLAHIVASLDQRFLPAELALLPAIESGYLPFAKSSGKAVGLWQIVPITAREIGIQRDTWFDGRGDILTSTRAAMDYLSFLSAEFNGDWELTLAAYNAGPGRVRAAVRKNIKAGKPTDYWSLDLPPETVNYVPKLIALLKLIKSENYGGFDMPHILMEPAFESIDIGYRVSIDKAAKIAGIDEELLRSLNAGLIHGVTPPEGPHYLLIPAFTGEQFQQAFANVDKTTVFSEPTTHEVVAGDTISSIAQKYGISQRRLLEMNGLDDSKIKIGQKLAAIDARNVPDSVVEYVVAIGDTLYDIAATFSVKIDDIRHSNGKPITGDIIHPGMTLNITVEDASSG